MGYFFILFFNAGIQIKSYMYIRIYVWIYNKWNVETHPAQKAFISDVFVDVEHFESNEIFETDEAGRTGEVDGGNGVLDVSMQHNVCRVAKTFEMIEGDI
jgi:hypothetical protein